jgi:hypothetical protein
VAKRGFDHRNEVDMELAGFESPLSDDQLMELGRFVVNCGFVEFLVGTHVGMLLAVSHEARQEVIYPLPLVRKVEILRRGLKTIHRQETRDLVKQACDLISPAINDRNRIVHGLWGYESSGVDAKAVAVSPKERSAHVRGDSISGHADALALATRRLMNAMRVDGGEIVTDTPERLVIELNCR